MDSASDASMTHTSSTPVDFPSDPPTNESSSASKPRKRKAKGNEAPATRKKRKGRLSVLPTLPLDVLFEIFLHLGPGDLLHLARTTRSFRSMLMTRQSAFLWKGVLDRSAEEGFPPAPEDISEPAWSALVFGKPWCMKCGKRTSNSIMWMLRLRICMNCVKEHLIIYHQLIRIGDMSTSFPEILPCDAVNYPHPYRRTKQTEVVFDAVAVDAYKQELKVLKEAYPDDSLFNPQRRLLHQSMSAAVSIRAQHASLCREIENNRTQERASELGDIREQRYGQIKKRLLAKGFILTDLNQSELRRHKDVLVSKPLTDRIWANIEEAVTHAAEAVRDSRLDRERRERAKSRKTVIASEYLQLMRETQHATTPFMPSVANFVRLQPVADALAADVPGKEIPVHVIQEALASSRTVIVPWMYRRAEALRNLAPEEWPRSSDGTVPDIDSLTTDLSAVALSDTMRDLDLISNAWVQQGGETQLQLMFGLDPLAEQRDVSKFEELTVKPALEAHRVILQILQLADLDPAQTTVLDMYTRDIPLVVCKGCEGREVSYMNNYVKPKHWWEMARHAQLSPHLHPSTVVPNTADVRPLTGLENRYARAWRAKQHLVDVPGKPHWGCCHCHFHIAKPVHLGLFSPTANGTVSTGDWSTLSAVKTHLQTEHQIEDGKEGVDFFYNRQYASERRPTSVCPLIPNNDLLGAAQRLENEVLAMQTSA